MISGEDPATGEEQKNEEIRTRSSGGLSQKAIPLPLFPQNNLIMVTLHFLFS